MLCGHSSKSFVVVERHRTLQSGGRFAKRVTVAWSVSALRGPGKESPAVPAHTREREGEEEKKNLSPPLLSCPKLGSAKATWKPRHTLEPNKAGP